MFISNEKYGFIIFLNFVTDSYGVADFELPDTTLDNLLIDGSIINIFDKTYHNHQNFNFINQMGFDGKPITEPGRNFTIFTRYNF